MVWLYVFLLIVRVMVGDIKLLRREELLIVDIKIRLNQLIILQ
jgi:hypothetical protein